MEQLDSRMIGVVLRVQAKCSTPDDADYLVNEVSRLLLLIRSMEKAWEKEPWVKPAITEAV